MYKPKSLAIYKNKPAIIKEIDDKIVITVLSGETIRVREKDIEVIHPGPVEKFSELEGGFPENFAHEAWELFVNENESFTLQDIASLSGGWTAKNAWQAFLLLIDGLYFEGESNAIRAKPANVVELELQKRSLKQTEGTQREAFISRLREKTIKLPEDLRFFQDIEALAFGKTTKSRMMKDAGLNETPEIAHKLLLQTGVWDNFVNPHHSRCGAALSEPKQLEGNLLNLDDRVDLTHLEAFAIDDENSTDPDDAVSLEKTPQGKILLYVHVADPTTLIPPNSPVDCDARTRGATLYSPEKIIRMLGEDSITCFALGLSEISPALTFKIVINNEFKIENTEIFCSKIHVTRKNYKEVENTGVFTPFFELSTANFHRRLAAGAIQFDFPEVHIAVNGHEIEIIPQENYPSRALVRECMLLAGEGAAAWALGNQLPFPFISQEIENIPNDVLPEFAGAFQLRRCMRPRILSVKPGIHQGLGLDLYTQVTSPLRRYTDLLAHMQIKAYLRNEAPISEDLMLARLAASERAAIAVNKAERASRAHFTAVYLADKIDSEWEGIIIERRGPHAIVLIPALGLEIQAAPPRSGNYEPNTACIMKLSSVKIPEAETRWTFV